EVGRGDATAGERGMAAAPWRRGGGHPLGESRESNRARRRRRAVDLPGGAEGGSRSGGRPERSGRARGAEGCSRELGSGRSCAPSRAPGSQAWRSSMGAMHRGFLLGAVAMGPSLPGAWGRGRVGGEEGASEVASRDRVLRIDDELRVIARSLEALRGESSATPTEPRAIAETHPVSNTESTPVATPVRPIDDDTIGAIRGAVRHCFSVYWRLSVDDSDGVKALVARSGKSPFDEGVDEATTLARRRLFDASARYEQDAEEIRSRMPQVGGLFSGGGFTNAGVEQAAPLLDAWKSERDARKAAFQKERQSILDELAQT